MEEEDDDDGVAERAENNVVEDDTAAEERKLARGGCGALRASGVPVGGGRYLPMRGVLDAAAAGDAAGAGALCADGAGRDMIANGSNCEECDILGNREERHDCVERMRVCLSYATHLLRSER